jgi:tripartite-type tricarboxylate transporter receptor subunit TctC
VREKLAAQDYEPQAGTPEQLAALITEDSARWQRIVKERNFKAE